MSGAARRVPPTVCAWERDMQAHDSGLFTAFSSAAVTGPSLTAAIAVAFGVRSGRPDGTPQPWSVRGLRGLAAAVQLPRAGPGTVSRVKAEVATRRAK